MKNKKVLSAVASCVLIIIQSIIILGLTFLCLVFIDIYYDDNERTQQAEYISGDGNYGIYINQIGEPHLMTGETNIEIVVAKINGSTVEKRPYLQTHSSVSAIYNLDWYSDGVEITIKDEELMYESTYIIEWDDIFSI